MKKECTDADIDKILPEQLEKVFGPIRREIEQRTLQTLDSIKECPIPSDEMQEK